MEIYISHAEADKELFKALLRHLDVIKSVYNISFESSSTIFPGNNREQTTFKRINSSDVILILLSADYLSDASTQNEMSQIRDLFKKERKNIIPIILKPCLWDHTWLKNFNAFPDNHKPIIHDSWKDTDFPFNDLVKFLIFLIEDEFESLPFLEIDEKIVSVGKKVFKIIVDTLLSNYLNVHFTSRSFIESLSHHENSIEGWSEETFVNSPGSHKKVNKKYINLNYFLTPLRNQFIEEDSIEIDLFEIFKNNRHIILLGQPGAGKTTSMKYICQSLIKNSGSLTISVDYID